MLQAVNLGHDADTTGAVCEQLAGTYWGQEGIPEDCRRRSACTEGIETSLKGLFVTNESSRKHRGFFFSTSKEGVVCKLASLDFYGSSSKNTASRAGVAPSVILARLVALSLRILGPGVVGHRGTDQLMADIAVRQ